MVTWQQVDKDLEFEIKLRKVPVSMRGAVLTAEAFGVNCDQHIQICTLFNKSLIWYFSDGVTWESFRWQPIKQKICPKSTLTKPCQNVSREKNKILNKMHTMKRLAG